ncbi:sulfite oxidase heme-binding subunit YedZ [Maliponia aquimaris]|uniref:Sulfoxide reductase heme-binding subunit YedZ n=1 Tax=Maliponia aquimaris TaxID=1673631 RepID=A0A238KP68_9RHOB|nr:ferric reductase-like transmembrane domain-containing protein [Maliponia aquimaris]SMX44629.1 Sulfoxide reductase heme-binding subunit YedZ [Maliponia aquimaris]
MSRLSPWWLWAVLALPGLGMAVDLVNSTDPRIFHRLLHPTGEFAARFMIIAMLATPLMLLFKGWRGPRWLKRNRRYFGVAAFAYALAHTVFYLVDKGTAGAVLAEVPRFYIWTGWLAFAIFIPLAVTSMDYFVRVMGPRWKALQRWTYPAAVLTLLHWAALHDWGSPAAALVHFGPLALLEGYRVWYWYLRPRPSVAA